MTIRKSAFFCVLISLFLLIGSRLAFAETDDKLGDAGGTKISVSSNAQFVPTGKVQGANGIVTVKDTVEYKNLQILRLQHN